LYPVVLYPVPADTVHAKFSLESFESLGGA